jgi:hypothetical protein
MKMVPIAGRDFSISRGARKPVRWADRFWAADALTMFDEVGGGTLRVVTPAMTSLIGAISSLHGDG